MRAIILACGAVNMSVTCPHCENEHDEETFEGFCEACGEEFEAESSDDEEEEDPYKHIVVGVIVSSEPIPKKSKLSKLLIDVGGEDEIQVVSNAKYMDEGALVVVAKIGAKVDDIVIKKTAVRFVVLCWQHFAL